MLATDTSSATTKAVYKACSFRKLVSWLADHVGHQHIPLRTHADDIHGLLGPDAVHHELVSSLIRKIYRANRCGHLDAPISMPETFGILGSVRADLAHRDETDIDQIDLIETIGWHTRRLFSVDPDSRYKTKTGSHGPVGTDPALRDVFG